MIPEAPTPPDCRGCAFPGHCPCFDGGDVRVPTEVLRILLHWAVRGGAKGGLYGVRKAVREAEEVLGDDLMEELRPTE